MMGTCLCNLVLQNRVYGVLLPFLKRKDKDKNQMTLTSCISWFKKV